MGEIRVSFGDLLHSNSTDEHGAKETMKVMMRLIQWRIERIEIDKTIHWTERLDSHSTVSTVSPSPSLGGLLDDNVLDQKVLDRKVLGIGVGLGVFEETKNDSDRLDGPSTLNFGCSLAQTPH